MAIILNGQQFAPGRIFRSGTLTDVDGDRAIIAASADNFLSTILALDLTNNTFQAIVQQGAPIPGTTSGETFGVVQRAAVSDSMIVFEGFNHNFQFVGLFAAVNGQILPIVRIGDTLNGHVVQSLSFQLGALDHKVMGFVAHFTGSGPAAYLAGLSPVRPTTAVSQKMHGATGIFDINLPLTGGPGVECRNSGGNHTLVFTTSNNLVSGNASVTTGTGSVSGSPSFAGNTMTVNLTGVTDVQKITVTLSGVTDSFAQVLPNTAVNMNVLVGDTNGDRSVSNSDISQTKAQSGNPVTAANFREDVNASGGTISSSDISQVKANSGHSVP